MQDNSNFDENYAKNIKIDVENGNYFKDSYDYFCISYLKPITDRTFYIFVSVIGICIIYFVLLIIINSFSIKEEMYITIKENDLTKYQTDIVDLTKYKESQSTDEEILQYLITNYVKERETHNYKSGNINDINTKLVKIRNNSSGDVFNEFKQFMSRDNANGPYYYFGKSIETKVDIKKFNYIRYVPKNFFEKIKNFFSIKMLLPIRAEVYYDLIINNGEKKIINKRKAVITYKYSTFEYDKDKDKYSAVKFYVTSYKNYIVK